MSALLTIGVLTTVVIIFCILMILPKEYGRVKWRRISLLIVSTFMGLLGWVVNNTEKVKTLKVYYEVNYPIFKNYVSSSEFAVIIFLLVLSALIILLHFFIQDKSVMKEHKNSFDEEFPEKEFKDRIKSFCNFLNNQLQQLNMDTNWSDAHFVPLDAEVEVLSANKKRRKITDLLSAIKKDKKSKTFLVLGDPGSGKSVALRTLSRELIKETTITYKIPIYINLKEWQISEKWSELTPPSCQSLYNFVILYLKGKDIFADDFIDKYFLRLFENGHIFFIFDSFDEIPAVLDENETSWLIDKLSEVLYNFLAGANDSRGILASRLYRRPSKRFQTKTILEIRPFSELKIEQALKKYVSFDKSLVNLLFKFRPEFLPIASNPFSIGLIYNYTKDNNNKLPNSQAELYFSYIDKRLNACNERIIRKKISKEKVLELAVSIAYYMFEKKNLGLEANIEELQKQFTNEPIAEVIDILVYARIGRLGSGNENRFSFVHRRFNEYFVVRRLFENPALINIDSIPLDSRYRDALVLYCEVAGFDEAERIAVFCWNEIKKIENVSLNDKQYLRGMNCLRFLREAYRARVNCLVTFQDELATLISSQIKKSKETGNILFVKMAVESFGILKKEDIEEQMLNALSLNNSWINDTAIKSSRYLSTVDSELKDKFLHYLSSYSILEFHKCKKEILFSLSLADGFKSLYKLIKIQSYDNSLKFLGPIPLSIIFPQVCFISIIL